VAQAVGRVIRTETDRGVALLLDDRYRQGAYRRLCPEHWHINHESGIRNDEFRVKDFWHSGESDE
jgi:Rad3-related DNA helicase